MKLKNIIAFNLDWKEFSEDGFAEFKKAFKSLGLYMGDILDDYSKEGNGTDTFCIYIAKRKLTPKELKEEFPRMFLSDDDEDQMELFDLNKYEI
jgi:hypothetical protein